MKKTNVDLIVGASILIALFVLVVGMMWLKESSLARQMVNYVVIFPEVGTLQLGDPVYVNGVKKGTVDKIDLRGTEVAAVLNLDKQINMTDSVRVAVVNVGLLGERGIGVTLSPHGRPIRHAAPGEDTTFIRGEFHTGISEAMGMLGTVLAEVETLVVNVGHVINASIGDTVFIERFHKIVGDLDTTLIIANRVLKRNEPVLNQTLSDLKIVSADLKDMINRVGPGVDSVLVGVDSLLSGGDELIAKGIALVDHADTLVSDVRKVMKRIESGEGSLGKLYKNDEFYNELRSVMQSVDTLVTEIKDDALRLRIRLGFGKKKKK